MAKVSFTKLGLKVNQEVKTIEWNEQAIEIKKYLPVNDKLQLISNVINQSIDEIRFMNPVKIKVYSMIEIIKYYTNISFTEKQSENIPKLYDLMQSTGILDEIIKAIPETEYKDLMVGIMDSIQAFYAYKNSLSGVIESVSQDYSDTNFDIVEIANKLLDPNAISTLKDLSNLSGFYETE